MIDPRHPKGQPGGPPPPSRRADLLRCAATLFEPGARALLHDDPINEGKAFVQMAVYGPRGVTAARVDETIEYSITQFWLAYRQAGVSRAECLTLMEGLIATLRDGANHLIPPDAQPG